MALGRVAPWWEVVTGDCVVALPRQKTRYRPFDVVFADPPYFLSNGGSTCSGGKRTSVDKGGWDVRVLSIDDEIDWTERWIRACLDVLSPTGSLWISGTMHSIPAVGIALRRVGCRTLNWVTWEKPNPPPNLGCRTFTHSTEVLIWASKSPKARHHFAYGDMRAVTGKQMKDVWQMTAPKRAEKSHGKHPTQKPVALLSRILAATCPDGGSVLDPFCGSGTTGVAAMRAGLGFVGIELDPMYAQIARHRIVAASLTR